MNLRGILPILETVGKACKKHGATEAHTKVLKHREFIQRCHDFPAEALAYWKAEYRALATIAFAPVDAVQLAEFASILPYNSMPMVMYSHLSFDYVIMMGLQNLASIEVADESCFLRLSGETLIQFITGIDVASHSLKNKVLWLSVLEYPEVAEALGRWPSPRKLLALMPIFGLERIVRVDGTQAWNWEANDAPTLGDTQGVTEMPIEESGTFEDPNGNLHHVFPFLAYQDEVASATPFASGVLPATGTVEEIIAEVVSTAYSGQLPVIEDPITVYHVLSLPTFEPFEDLLTGIKVAQVGVDTQTASVFDGESVCDESSLDTPVCEKADFGSDISTLLDTIHNAPKLPTTGVDRIDVDAYHFSNHEVTNNGPVDDETQDSMSNNESDGIEADELCSPGDDNQDADSRSDGSSLQSLERAIASFERSSIIGDAFPNSTWAIATLGDVNVDLEMAFVDWLGWQRHFENFDVIHGVPDMFTPHPPEVPSAKVAETTPPVMPIPPTKCFPGEADLLSVEGSSSTPNIAAEVPFKTASTAIKKSPPALEIVAKSPLDDACTPQRWSTTPILIAAAAGVVFVSVINPALTSVVCVMGIYWVKRILRP